MVALYRFLWTNTVQLNYNLTIPCVNLYGFPQCHRWLLLRGIRVPHLLTLNERGIMLLFYELWWSHACEAHRSHGNPNYERVNFVRLKFSLTLIRVVEWKDLSDVGRTEATPILLRLVFCIVIFSSRLTHPCKIMWNIVEKLVTIALNIFFSCWLFSMEFLFTTDHKAWFHAKSRVVLCMEFHVCMKL